MSSNDIAIRVCNLSKCFRAYDSPLDRIKQLVLPTLKRIAGRPLTKEYFREFCALQSTSFEVKKGETVGIVGRNGSGKSTLLQLICGTLTPSSGHVEIIGRIAALLELGSGFNPDFTGRENVYLNASILGFTNQEIDARFDDIASFADIGQFIEQPVKTYSSGMTIRLAFAVAINVDPDILVIDEALSVGDELFQRKCFSRIAAIRARGTTILFVSHSGQTIVELCDRVILMDAGEKLSIGTPNAIVGSYHRLLYAPASKKNTVCQQIRQAQLDTDNEVAPANDLESWGKAHDIQESYDQNLKPSRTVEYESIGAYIDSPAIFSSARVRVNNLINGEEYYFSYVAQFTSAARNVRFGMLIKTTSGMELGGGVSAYAQESRLDHVAAGDGFNVEFRFHCVLNEGMYFVNAGIVGEVEGNETFLHRLVDAAMFRVMPKTKSLMTGIVDFSCTPTIKQCANKKPK